jgi:hypothetical protein
MSPVDGEKKEEGRRKRKPSLERRVDSRALLFFNFFFRLVTLEYGL